MNKECTAVICTRNSGTKLIRAVESCIRQARVLVIDDFSEDDSVERIKRLYPSVVVAKPDLKVGLGNARNFALSRVETPWMVWLDADDEFLPNRVSEMLAVALESNADLVFDNAELFDGLSKDYIRHLTIPSFLAEKDAQFFIFMRNWLPGSAWPLVRTNVAKTVGYSKFLLAAEDLDFNLRAILLNCALVFSSATGYRQYAYDDSLSRDIDQQNREVQKVLRKISLTQLQSAIEKTTLQQAKRQIIIGNFLIRRGDYLEASIFLDRGISTGTRESTNLECQDTFVEAPFTEFEIFFQQAALRILSDKISEALDMLLKLLVINNRSAEVYNNVGVCYGKLEQPLEATKSFKRALELFPLYYDAKKNLSDNSSNRVTLYPIRKFPSRVEY